MTNMRIIEDNDFLFHIRPATASDNTLLAEMGAETFYDSFAGRIWPPI
ncbi:MAG TPA: hypothetical protein PLA74_04980 [Syntrophales bacterium]|nr:hypothetical protein [Syntrophales bacterium]HPQ43806.1 hypothetical protein [Syntrophales bacterium]